MILILVLAISLACGQVTHDPIVPSIETVKIGSQIKTVPANTAFRHIFRTYGYDIGGKVY